MRIPTIMLCLATVALPAAAHAQAATAPAAATPAPSASTKHYSTADTEIGTLLDDPAARAILDKRVPGMTGNEQIDMARSMTLKGIQQYSPDAITDKVLAEIDADFAKIPAK
jgi:para-nitrobenzyl esterase